MRLLDRFGPALGQARVEYRGGVSLRAGRALGGLSGVLVSGTTLLAASDTGRWFAATMILEAGRLTGIEGARLWRRRGLDGEPIRDKVPGDAEALARAPGGVDLFVESTRQLLTYPADGLEIAPDAVPERRALPAGLQEASRRGVEAIARLPNGALFVVVESRNGTGSTLPAFLLPGGELTVQRHDGFAITGASALPGGDMILVERRYGGGLDVRMRVRRIGADGLIPGGLADGPTLLDAGLSAEIDNMEAVAAEVVDGEIILTLLSDDNHSFWQRTLVLRFAVSDPLPMPNPRR
ncbi:MAG: esterase-like activity of phytase family protein [Pseudomonadota bacterium]